MGFLDALSDSLKEQVGLTENTPGNLDTTKPFGKLGKFANQIDQSAERRYVESGVLRNIKPKALEIINQEPDITVLIKKRMFSSLAENNNVNFMDENEKLFIRSSKRLFESKCKAITAYEKLTKFERIAAKNDGLISDYAFPALFGAVDFLNNFGPTSGLISGKTQATLDSIRKVKALSDPNIFTTWVNDKDMPMATELGDGTGVIELTTVASLNTKVSTEFGTGNASLTIEDPYKLMTISKKDIDQAISDATSAFKQNDFFRFSDTLLARTTEDLKTNLNQLRMKRSAGAITFSISENTILFKKVRAILDRAGVDINFEFDAGLFGSNLFSFETKSVVIGEESLYSDLFPEGLTEEEIELFSQIIQNLFNLLSLGQTTKSEIKDFNKSTNYVRRKMRLHYAGKFIIQPMDVVSIFISSKAQIDTFISKGLNSTFAKNSLLNSVSNSIGNLESALDDIKNAFGGSGGGGSFLENERNAIVGPDFPLWLWNMMRNDFTRQAAGTCVFSGPVSGVNRSFQAGKYILSVSCQDNTNFLKKGQLNINPSVSVPNSGLLDPLTPFDLEFDASSGFVRGEVPPLLDANIRLLHSGSVRAKLGRFRGQGLTEKTYKAEDVEQISSNIAGSNPTDGFKKLRRKFTDPDGFVYKWKEGIGSLVLGDQPHLTSVGSFKTESSPSMTVNPLAGQDVMNVLSLLITGQAYSFTNFVKGALDSGKLNKNDISNEDMSASFFRGLIAELTKQNSIWGNFIPFKELIVNESAYQFLASGEFDLVTKNKKLSLLLSKRADLYDHIAEASSTFALDESQFFTTGFNGAIGATTDNSIITGVAALQNQMNDIDEEIQTLTDDFQKKINQFSNIKTKGTDGSITIFGDDITFDSTITEQDGELNETKRREERSELRKKLNYLTQRRLWRVKGNEDPNYFIVDDSYDKNYDIQAFEATLANQLELFRSTYNDSFTQINLVKSILGLEVFADSQGHIRARPPQYNRMPSSVFAEMLRTKTQDGIQIFPKFLESLFFNRVSGIIENLEIVEDQIRLRTAVLGATTDSTAESIIKGNSGSSNTNFSFLTQEADGKFGGKDIRSVFRQNAPDLEEDRSRKALEALSEQVDASKNSTINFDITKRIQTSLNKQFLTVFGNNITVALDKISARLKQKTGQNIPSNIQSILSNDRVTKVGERSQADLVKLTSEIAQFVAERQRLIKTLSHDIRNLREGVEVNADNESQQTILFPNLNESSEKVFPEILEHMIEDESVDDLGLNSGSRYIIKDSQIISYSVSENEPPYTYVEIEGRINQGLTSQNDLDVGGGVSGGGNPLATAFAVDYDLWRMYGFRAQNSITVPFFSDPHSQCAPYAVYLLNLARQQIFTAQCTIVGNEFLQAGEVYYLEDDDMLFYASSVSHSFQYNGSFTSSLELTFGRNPGEYIPTQLDIIGKGLYSNRYQSDIVKQVRHNSADGSSNLAVLIHDTTDPVLNNFSSNITELVKGKFGTANRKALGNMMLACSGILSPSSFGTIPVIQVRIYKNTNDYIGLDSSSNLEKLASSVKDWLARPVKISSDGQDMLPDTGPDNKIINVSFDTDRIQVEIVDLDPELEGENRSPSSAAWSTARSIVASTNLPLIENFISSQEQLDQDMGKKNTTEETNSKVASEQSKREVQALINCIIDIWVTFIPTEQFIESTKKQEDPTDQASQEAEGKL